MVKQNEKAKFQNKQSLYDLNLDNLRLPVK